MENVHPLTAYRASHEPPLTEAELARKLGVGRPTLHRWEKRQRKIDSKFVPLVSEKTGIPAKELRPDLVEEHERLFGEAAQ
jgi:transcriptional regulator with XRE-family HTH domain